MMGPSGSGKSTVGLPMRLAGKRVDRAWALEVLERVGLADRLKHRPAELSGGQQQRDPEALAELSSTRPSLSVVSTTDYVTSLTTEPGLNLIFAWALVALCLACCAIAIVNTLIVATFERRAGFAQLRSAPPAAWCCA